MSDAGSAPYVLCCPDKLRGSLTADAAAEALCAGVRECGLAARAHPIADGGEGTLDAFLRCGLAEVSALTVSDALGRPRSARLGWLPGGTALVETAEVVGLGSLALADRDVMRASTAGVGEMIRAALGQGARRVIVAVGGTATIDGGLGALRALGARLLDGTGAELSGSGASLLRVRRADSSGLIPAARAGAIEFALDAYCPLHGEGGTAAVFGPQKGATRAQVDLLDAALEAHARRLGLPPDVASRVGTGGGLAAPFVALCGAGVRSGAELVLRETGFDAALRGASACITAEGRVDRQTTLGKAVQAVVRTAHRRGIPAVVVAGAVEDGAAPLYASGATAIFPIGREPRAEPEAHAMAERDLRWAGRAVGRLLAARLAPEAPGAGGAPPQRTLLGASERRPPGRSPHAA